MMLILTPHFVLLLLLLLLLLLPPPPLPPDVVGLLVYRVMQDLGVSKNQGIQYECKWQAKNKDPEIVGLLLQDHPEKAPKLEEAARWFL